MNARNAELLEAYAIALRAQRMSPRTVESRVSLLRAWARRDEVDLLAATLQEMRVGLGRTTVSIATSAALRYAMRSFYQWLVDDDYRRDNPALNLAPIRVPKAKPRPYSEVQVQTMLARSYFRTRVMILLAYRQGLRAAEIAAAHADDFDLGRMQVRVLGKGSKLAYLPMHPDVALVVRRMGTGWWFPARRGREGHIHGRSVSTLLSQARDRAGIVDRRLTGHSLRHAYATELVHEGVNLKVVQELMRHESLATTERYVGIGEQQLVDGIHSLPSVGILEHRRARIFADDRDDLPAAA